MYRQYKPRTVVLIFCGLMLFVLACTCGPLNTITEVQTTLGAIQGSLEPALTEMALTMTAVGPTAEAALATAKAGMPEIEATLTAAAGMVNVVPGVELRQWASGATATSEFEPDSWSAMQATGAPNTAECGDIPTAWASGSSGEVATLTLAYSVAVVPSSIEIHQSYAPGSITKVEVVDEAGTPSIIYQAQPAAVDQCPYVQIVPVTGVTAKVKMVIITVDQSVITDWNEIDAVELIGIP
jgi:hypothetical protein